MAHPATSDTITRISLSCSSPVHERRGDRRCQLLHAETIPQHDQPASQAPADEYAGPRALRNAIEQGSIVYGGSSLDEFRGVVASGKPTDARLCSRARRAVGMKLESGTGPVGTLVLREIERPVPD